MNFASMDAKHRDAWEALVTPKGIGMILRSIRTDYKFVSYLPIQRETCNRGFRERMTTQIKPGSFFLLRAVLKSSHSQNVADCGATPKPIKYPDRVTVLHKLRSMPKADTDHFILDVVIVSELHRRIAARCVEDVVIYDYKAKKKSTMEPFMVEMLQETVHLQEQTKVKHGNKALELIQRVQALEKGSWDRADAKEDFGSVIA